MYRIKVTDNKNGCGFVGRGFVAVGSRQILYGVSVAVGGLSFGRPLVRVERCRFSEFRIIITPWESSVPLSLAVAESLAAFRSPVVGRFHCRMTWGGVILRVILKGVIPH